VSREVGNLVGHSALLKAELMGSSLAALWAERLVVGKETKKAVSLAACWAVQKDPELVKPLAGWLVFYLVAWMALNSAGPLGTLLAVDSATQRAFLKAARWGQSSAEWKAARKEVLSAERSAACLVPLTAASSAAAKALLMAAS
jgi:hypothetical protein